MEILIVELLLFSFLAVLPSFFFFFGRQAGF